MPAAHRRRARRRRGGSTRCCSPASARSSPASSRWRAAGARRCGPTVDIDLSLWALPRYTLLSLARGVAAYVLSLTFTLIYGTIAAHSRAAERIMIPILDILQGIPVLGFLPGLVLGMVALFPHSNIGLELACVVMIFTGQVWNMTFSFYGSLRAIPTRAARGGARLPLRLVEDASARSRCRRR